MDLKLSDEQDQIWSVLDRLLGSESTTAHVRAAEPMGFDSSLWRHLVDMGIPAMTDRNGADLRTVSVAVECHGRHLASVPMVEAIVVNRLLGRCGRSPVDDAEVSTLALRPAVDGIAELVPAGAIASRVVGLCGETLMMVSGSPSATSLVHNLGSLPLADRSLLLDSPMADVISTGLAARLEHRRAVAEWRLLTGAFLVGLSQRALEIGVDYVKHREAFGVPIGSFQAVAHGLADAATATSGARLLVRKAAWALDLGRDDAESLATMAFLFAGQAAELTTSRVLHFHGGYGFMLEYDIQLYFRRAKAATVVGGGATAVLRELSDCLYPRVVTT
ncbi:MAG: acyl-CoA dehydrogenase protein [Ilumatobacteraceae bacterium]|nr:acyl-CoA dehydrogenase protein [Ilumatobacteraceae bacterium]